MSLRSCCSTGAAGRFPAARSDSIDFGAGVLDRPSPSAVARRGSWSRTRPACWVRQAPCRIAAAARETRASPESSAARRRVSSTTAAWRCRRARRCPATPASRNRERSPATGGTAGEQRRLGRRRRAERDHLARLMFGTATRGVGEHQLHLARSRRSLIAADVPLYGTCWMSRPYSVFNASMNR